MPLQFKPKDQQARIVYSSAPQAAYPEHEGKTFAVIGPFESFDDKQELQRALLMLMRGWNIQSDSE